MAKVIYKESLFNKTPKIIYEEASMKELDFYKPAPVGEYLEGPGMPLIMKQGEDPMNDKSSKATNSEIVKALLVLTQDFFNHNPDDPHSHKSTVDDQLPYQITITEDNLVERISMALNAYRRQKDRMADVMNQMKRIESGE